MTSLRYTKDVDDLDKILEELDDNLSNAPGSATDIGWEAWSEEKQEYYKQAKAALYGWYKQQAYEDFLELIGEDENEFAAPPREFGKALRRNEAKAKLRELAKKKFKQ